jgi:hypothetical protein
MNTTSKQQASDISSLISSLGLKPTTILTTAKGFDKIVDSYHVTFTPDVNPFLCRNKDYFNNNIIFNKYSTHRYITKIEKVDTIPTKCLAVESDTHCYLFGYNYIKTHNTNKKIDTTSMFGNMLDPVSHLNDCNYNHYRLQISVYAWMLEQAGYKVRGTRFTHLNNPYIFNYMKDEVEAILGIKKDFNYL